MADPIVEQIRADIKTTLETITTVNGYENTVTVEEHSRLGNPPTDKLLVLHQDDGLWLDNAAHQHHRWNQLFWVVGYVIEAEDASTAIARRINTLRADVEKAMMVDATRNSLALDSTPGNFSLFEVGDVDGFAAQWFVDYRTLETSPYSQ